MTTPTSVFDVSLARQGQSSLHFGTAGLNQTTMEIESYNRQELLNLPVRDWKMTSKYKQILIVPTEELHESGYRLMAVIGIENGKPKEIAAFCDDIEWTVPYTEYPVIRTDMFPNNIIRFHSNHGRFVVGESLSSTDIEFELK